MSIERLDARNRRDLEEIAHLHREYLSDSPVVRFGYRFLRDFYYDALVRDGLVGASICKADGKMVGFISYAMEPLGFMTRGVRHHPLRLARVMAMSVLARPATARDIATVMTMMRERRGERETGAMEGTGEVLSLVADREYRAYVPPGGESRLAVRMFEHAVEVFRENGIQRIHLLVQPENMESNLFCASMGCEFEKITTAGNPVHRYTYSLEPAAPEPVVETSD